MAGRGDPRDSATENKPPNQGKGEKVWQEHTGWFGNRQRMENPTESKTE